MSKADLQAFEARLAALEPIAQLAIEYVKLNDQIKEMRNQVNKTWGVGQGSEESHKIRNELLPKIRTTEKQKGLVYYDLRELVKGE